MIYDLGPDRVVLPEDGDYWIAPGAHVIGRVVLKRDASVWFGAVIRADNAEIVIGEGSNVQDNAVLHADPGFPLTLGSGVTVGHQAMLHGCTVGDRSLIGIGAVVLNGAVIGEDCLIGAGALIPEGKLIPSGSLVIGQPGRVKRMLEPAELQHLRFAGETYVKNARRYAATLKARA